MKGTRWAWCLGVGLIVLAGTCLRADEPDIKAAEKILAQANLKTDGPALLAFFQKRTLTDADRMQVEALIQQLGSNSFAKRELATAKLIAKGPVVIDILKKYYEDKDLEISGRAKKCVEEIQERDTITPKILMAALHVLADRKPPSTVETMLNFLPFANVEEVSEETRKMLAALAVTNGKAEPALVKGLTDKNNVIRSAAGEALALAKDKEHEAQVWKLLNDPDILVKYRVALGLTLAEQPKAVPALIGLVPLLEYSHASQIELMLVSLAEEKDRPAVSLGQDKESRENFTKAWSKWWAEKGAKVSLARLKDGPKLLGYTLLVLLEANQIMELGPNNEVRWQINNLNFPLDVQLLPNDHVLIAEYYGNKVTERDFKGNIKWQCQVSTPLGMGPQAAQRLDNGNTFIVTDEELLEVDKNKTNVFSHKFPKGERVMKAVKLGDGRMVCLTNGMRVVILDEKGKEKKTFNVVPLAKSLFGGRLYMTPTGRVLIPHNAEDKVVEYDLEGKNVWELKVKQPVAAVRLPNGNTLVTTMDSPGKVIEFDRLGKEVWFYQTQANTKITRALRR